MKLNRIIDANINRATEGLRVLEEFSRFLTNNTHITNTLKSLRHGINSLETHKHLNVSSRDTSEDLRARETPASRADLKSILTANAKRVQEALRVLEEYSGDSQFNAFRYDMYDLEKEILNHLPKHSLRGAYIISHDPEILLDALKQGAGIIQLRDKDGTKENILNKARYIQSKHPSRDVPFIINDYCDIAMLIDADGLHTGQDDLPISDIRNLLGHSKICGRTTHSLEQGLKAQKEGADYVSVGPLWETPSKPNRAGIGLEYLREAATELSIPYVAIGGISDSKIDSVLSLNPPMVGLIRHRHLIQKVIDKTG